MRKIANYFIKFIPYNSDPYYISLDNVLAEHQDTYQDERDDILYEWSDKGRGWKYNPID